MATEKEFNGFVHETLGTCKTLLNLKGGEYTEGTDRLSGFKIPAISLGITPLQVALVYADKHYSAIKTYVRDSAEGRKRDRLETIEGRVHDMINYCLFIAALIAEQESEER